MKSMKVILTLSIIPALAMAWFRAPKEIPNGWYYMYDDEEPGPPFNHPRVYPLADVEFIDLHDDPGAQKIEMYSDTPHKYVLEDSFWFYGTWYDDGTYLFPDYLYIDDEGQVSFDDIAEDGFANPPLATPPFPHDADPQTIIAPLWQDMNTTQGGDPDNRVYYKYDEDSRELIIHWYRTQGHSNTNWYDFELILQMGGQDRLVIEDECGTVFSYHFIHFLYNTTNNGWDADNLHSPPAVGLENETGEYGIYYQGTLVDSRKIRMGYKRIIEGDEVVTRFIVPGEMVLRWQDYDIQFEIANMGSEATVGVAGCKIYDEDDNLVYEHTQAGYALAGFERDTAQFPAWMPEEIGERYWMHAWIQEDGEGCNSNDTLIKEVYVGCDDTLRYLWNKGDWVATGELSSNTHLLTGYLVDNGVLVTGARAWLPSIDGQSLDIELYSANTSTGEPDSLIASQSCDDLTEGWNYVQFGTDGVWLPSDRSGVIWTGMTPSSSGQYREYAMTEWPFIPPYYNGSGPGFGGHMNPDFSWGGYTSDFYTPKIELFTHLGFGPWPLPFGYNPYAPYVEVPHDIKVFDVNELEVDYVEAGVPLTPEVAIANLGYDKEPYSGFFPVYLKVVDEFTLDTVFSDSHMVSEIGYLGDPADDPDSLYISIGPWTPEGTCDEDEPFTHYEILGIARLGEVGPDESDHCPYNDTILDQVTCLWSHDMGAIDIEFDPEPREPPDIYHPGDTVWVTVTIENFGFNDEVDIPVSVTIMDVDSNNAVLYKETDTVPFLDWRGTVFSLYTTEIVLPPYMVTNDHHQLITATTELEGDMCSANDSHTRHIMSGIVEDIVIPAFFYFEAVSYSQSGRFDIEYGLPQRIDISLNIYDINGRIVNTLVNDAAEPGYHQLTWDGTDITGKQVSAGIYLIQLEAGDYKQTEKVMKFK